MRKVVRYSAFIGQALVAWGLWIAEVCWFKGWAGLAWTHGFNWSSLPICAVIAIASNYSVAMQAEIARRLLFVGVGWAMMTAGFTLARWAAEEFFSSWLGAGANYALYFFIAILAVSAGLTLSASRWLVPMRYWTAFLVAIGLLSAIPLSYATIQIFPALNGDKDTLHSIKMGYPVFWTAVLVPMALFLGRKKQ